MVIDEIETADETVQDGTMVEMLTLHRCIVFRSSASTSIGVGLRNVAGMSEIVMGWRDDVNMRVSVGESDIKRNSANGRKVDDVRNCNWITKRW